MASQIISGCKVGRQSIPLTVTTKQNLKAWYLNFKPGTGLSAYIIP